MANQRAIAEAAGVNQATVSLALRNSKGVSEATRKRIQRIATEMGYHPHSYVSTLMSHIRSGRPPRDKGCIALVGYDLNDNKSNPTAAPYYGGTTYMLQRKGMLMRAKELGFTIERFDLRTENLTLKRIDGILCARGICGLVLGPFPQRNHEFSKLSLSQYAMATISYSCTEPSIDRVTTYHRHNVEKAFNQLRLNGYRRIGMCLSPEASCGVDYGWKAGYLLEQDASTEKDRMPLFIGKPGITPISEFQRWIKKWKPEAIITIVAHEKDWLDELGIQVPNDIQLACLNRLSNTPFPGIDEKHEVVGSKTVEIVADQIMRNEFGLPKHPRIIMIEGEWKEN